MDQLPLEMKQSIFKRLSAMEQLAAGWTSRALRKDLHSFIYPKGVTATAHKRRFLRKHTSGDRLSELFQRMRKEHLGSKKRLRATVQRKWSLKVQREFTSLVNKVQRLRRCISPKAVAAKEDPVGFKDFLSKDAWFMATVLSGNRSAPTVTKLLSDPLLETGSSLSALRTLYEEFVEQRDALLHRDQLACEDQLQRLNGASKDFASRYIRLSKTSQLMMVVYAVQDTQTLDYVIYRGLMLDSLESRCPGFQMALLELDPEAHEIACLVCMLATRGFEEPADIKKAGGCYRHLEDCLSSLHSQSDAQLKKAFGRLLKSITKLSIIESMMSERNQLSLRCTADELSEFRRVLESNRINFDYVVQINNAIYKTTGEPNMYLKMPHSEFLEYSSSLLRAVLRTSQIGLAAFWENANPAAYKHWLRLLAGCVDIADHIRGDRPLPSQTQKDLVFLFGGLSRAQAMKRLSDAKMVIQVAVRTRRDEESLLILARPAAN